MSMEEKVKKVDDTITKIQTQVQEIQLKIKPNTPPKERERRENLKEASNTLQQLSAVQPQS